DGYDGRITLVGAEPHAPYDRPPLSKEVLRGEWGPERVALRRNGLADLDLDLRLGRRAVELRARDRTVALDDALALRADLERSPRRVVVVGAGFIGLEVAASCRARGLETTVVEPQPAP